MTVAKGVPTYVTCCRCKRPCRTRKIYKRVDDINDGIDAEAGTRYLAKMVETGEYGGAHRRPLCTECNAENAKHIQTLEKKMKAGDLVTLHCPENNRLHNTQATLLAKHHWGWEVSAPAAASGQYRAAWEELIVQNTQLHTKAVQAGYTGDICWKCQGAHMVRAGSCMTCTDCGESSGCG